MSDNGVVILICFIVLSATIVLSTKPQSVSVFNACLNPENYYVDAMGDLNCEEVLQYAGR